MKKRGGWHKIVCMSIFAVMLFVSSTSVAGESELRVGWLSDEVLNSLVCGESWQYSSMGCVFWPIVYDQAWVLGTHPDYAPVLWAAENIETKDNVHYRYTMRDSMTFHDGKPVTASDIAFSYEYLPQSDPTWSYPYSQAENFVVIDDKTFEFTMQNPHGGKYPPFFWTPILPIHIWRRHKHDMLEYSNDKAIGSGPFKLAEFEPGQFMVFEKHEGHWNREPRVDKIVFKAYGSGDARNMAIRRGEVDMDGYSGVSPMTLKYFQDDPNIEAIINPGISMVWLTFNMLTDNGINELAIRKAIVHSVDKEKFVEMVYHNYAKSHDSFIYPELAEYNKNLPQYDYNPERSNMILDEAGFVDSDGDGIRNYTKTGKNMNYRLMAFSSEVEVVKMAQMMREMMKPIGIGIDITVVDIDTYYSLYYAPGQRKFDIAFGSEEPGPYASWIWEFMRGYTNGGEGWNTAGYDNREFDELLDAYNSELDVEKGYEKVRKMQMIMSTDLPHYVLVRPDTINPVRTDKLQGYVSAMGGINNWINPWTFFKVHGK